MLDEWNILHPSNQFPHSLLLDCAAAATPRQSSRGCFRTVRACSFLILRFKPGLGGGFKYFYVHVHPYFGKIHILTTNIFQRGWFNHQPAGYEMFTIAFLLRNLLFVVTPMMPSTASLFVVGNSVAPHLANFWTCLVEKVMKSWSLTKMVQLFLGYVAS